MLSYALSWKRMPSADRLSRRLLVDGELRLQQTFRIVLTQSGDQPERIVLAETDPESEFGVLEKGFHATP